MLVMSDGRMWVDSGETHSATDDILNRTLWCTQGRLQVGQVKQELFGVHQKETQKHHSKQDRDRLKIKRKGINPKKPVKLIVILLPCRRYRVQLEGT